MELYYDGVWEQGQALINRPTFDILVLLIFIPAFIAIFWLLIETDWLRIRLPYGSTNKSVLNEMVHADLSITDTEEPVSPAPQPLTDHYISKDTTPYTPSVFVQSEIPTLDGELNISCKLEG